MAELLSSRPHADHFALYHLRGQLDASPCGGMGKTFSTPQ